MARIEAPYNVDQDEDKSVEFYTEAVEDEKLTVEAGRPMFKEVEMCRISNNGDPHHNLIVRSDEPVFFVAGARGSPVRRAAARFKMETGHLTAAQRFPEHYKQYLENNKTQIVLGTPIEMAPWLSKIRKAEFIAQQINTIEQLAKLNETAIQRLGAREDVEKAQVYLGHATQAAVISKANAERDAMERRFAELEAKLAAATAPKPTEGPDVWGEERLRAYLTEAGLKVRANASHANLIEAVKLHMADVDA